MRYVVGPRSTFRVVESQRMLGYEAIHPQAQIEPPGTITIDNPTDRAIVVTIEAPEAVAAETGDLINRWLAIPPTDWQANRRYVPPQVIAIEPPPQSPDMSEMVRTPLSAAADVALQIANLERQMQQRNAERAQEQAFRDLMNYRAHLGVPDGSSRAVTRSRKLLREHLSPEQLTAWDRDGYFAVKGNVSGEIYHLTMGGVQRILDGHEFCLQLVGDEWTPLCDAVLARKILLECDETKFLATANNLTIGNGPERPRGTREPQFEWAPLRPYTLTERMVAATARLFGGTGD